MSSNNGNNNIRGAISREELIRGLEEGEYNHAEIRKGRGGVVVAAFDSEGRKVFAGIDPWYMPEIERYVPIQLELDLQWQKNFQSINLGRDK